jgi:PPM family protein phosphatase
VKVGSVASATHPGRKRRQNEDAYVCRPPLFAVTDGMGGAQAGELASRLAAAALTEGASDAGQSAEQRVAALLEEANRRVYARAAADDAAAGMGTTATVAIVEAGRVVIGHVGDSRAYLIRTGTLDQLTDDHSLVAELVRGGKLSPEEAERHPQRSVVTRVLGPEPDVDVDVFSVDARPGDLFLLCSDGLTSMVSDDEIRAVIERHRDDLDEAASALIRAANRGGGEDNITVVVFELEGRDDDSAATVVSAAAQQTEDDDDTLDELTAVPTALPAPQPPRRRTRRLVVAAVTAFLVVVLVGLAGVWAISRSHFVGTGADGHVTVYQGVPWNLVGGARLYRAVYVSPLLAAQLWQPERRRLFDHDLQSKDAAMATVRRYEQRLGL